MVPMVQHRGELYCLEHIYSTHFYRLHDHASSGVIQVVTQPGSEEAGRSDGACFYVQGGHWNAVEVGLICTSASRLLRDKGGKGKRKHLILLMAQEKGEKLGNTHLI